jgi:hypothetical protein
VLERYAGFRQKSSFVRGENETDWPETARASALDEGWGSRAQLERVMRNASNVTEDKRLLKFEFMFTSNHKIIKAD